jgi:hypothetical protein
MAQLVLSAAQLVAINRGLALLEIQHSAGDHDDIQTDVLARTRQKVWAALEGTLSENPDPDTPGQA